MRLFLLIFALILSASCEDEIEDENLTEMDLSDEFLNAQSPMESQYHLGIIQLNFPGLYDDVFAGIESR